LIKHIYSVLVLSISMHMYHLNNRLEFMCKIELVFKGVMILQRKKKFSIEGKGE